MQRTITAILLIVILAACGQPSSTASLTPPIATPVPPTATSPAPTQPAPTVTPIRVDLTPAQRAAMQALVKAGNVSVDQIKLISTEAVQWPDGCLGIIRMGVMCTQGPVAGFRIMLEADGKQYEVHTNQDGTAAQLTAKPPFASIAVRALDNSVQIVDTHVPNDQRPVAMTTGLLPQAGTTAGTIYALDFANQPRAVAVDATGTHPLDFIHNPNYGLTVRPGDTSEAVRLSWATSPSGDAAQSQLFSSAPDASQLTALLTETITGTTPHQLVAQRWSRDGQSL